MTNFVLVSRDTLATKRWISTSRYDFARTLAISPISDEELIHASREMPCAFTKTEGRYSLSVVLSLQPDMNLFVSPDGSWNGSYIPALFRAYPFRLAKVQGKDDLALVIDEDGGLSSDGEPFFDEEGKPMPKVAEYLEFLTQIERGRLKADEVVKQLDEAGLIEEWPLTIKSEDGNEQKIEGLYRIAEQKLNQLDDETFLKLRRSQALPIAYIQLLSMRNIDTLGKLAMAQIGVAQKQASRASELFPGDRDGDLKFDWSKLLSKD
jgi:hypothetical protein